MDLIDVYSQLTQSDIDSEINFISSLDYLEQGIKLAEALLYIINNNENIQIAPSFRCPELYPDNSNFFDLCWISGNPDPSVEIKHNDLCKVHKIFNGLISIEMV